MGQSLKQRQARRPRPSFVLTPLIDVMFLLLIFFMLSSQISPYSLMPVSKVAGVAGEEESTGATVIAELAIRVSRGFVTIGGQRIEAGDVASEVRRLVSQGIDGFLVISTGSATVQDIVTTIEALQAESAENVTLVSAGGRGR